MEQAWAAPVVMDGGIYTGGSFSAGEVGGMVVHGGQRDAEADIFSGCYERYASVTALVNAAGKLDASLTDGRHILPGLGNHRSGKTWTAGLMKSFTG